jgi:UDP-2,3-diacylglucosamine pyrophosphatase LpxH
MLTSVPAEADRLLVVMSDIEMGNGGETDDFPHTLALGQLLLEYNGPAYDHVVVHLVFNGDTFDFLKTPLQGDYPRHITAVRALAKLELVASVHADFFEAVAAFVARPDRQVSFLVGNHDPELVFTAVQAEIRRLCGGSNRVTFPGFFLDVGQVHIEHGSQADRMFRMDADQPLLQTDEGPILNLPWGSVALLEVVIPLHPILHLLDRVRPRAKLFEIMPEAKELLLGRYWRYWTRDYLRGLIRHSDPLHHLTWSMVKEIVYRFVSVDTDVSIAGHYRRQVMSSEAHRLYIIGHRHEASWWSYGDRKLLQTGCLRDEFMLDDDGRLRHLIPKSYAEACLQGDTLLYSHLVEPVWRAPARVVPESVRSVRQTILRLLGTARERTELTEAREAHEAEHEPTTD